MGRSADVQAGSESHAGLSPGSCRVRPAAHRHPIIMIHSLLSLLIAGLVLYLIFYITGMFIKGQPLKIIGIILGLVFLLHALRVFNILAV